MDELLLLFHRMPYAFVYNAGSFRIFYCMINTIYGPCVYGASADEWDRLSSVEYSNVSPFEANRLFFNYVDYFKFVRFFSPYIDALQIYPPDGSRHVVALYLP